jgi:cytochrome c553
MLPERPRYKSPLGIAVDPGGRLAYVALHTANALAVVDLRDGVVQCEIAVGRKPYDVALHKGIAYVTCEADDTLVAVDVVARAVHNVFQVAQAPRGVAVDPVSGSIEVVCHDEKILWKRNQTGVVSRVPLPPQPEGNYARASNIDLVVDAQVAVHRQRPRPFNLFTGGHSLDSTPKPPTSDPRHTAFNPTRDLNTSRTSMDLVAHTRPRWFISTVHAPDKRVFTNAFSFFLNRQGPAAVLLLDEPEKGYPDPTDVVVKLPKKELGRVALVPLAPNGKAANHPLKGSKVFISSGGADTVLVLDMDKAVKHAETHPNGMQFGMIGMGGMQVGGNFGGWNSGFGQPHSVGGGFGGWNGGAVGNGGGGLNHGFSGGAPQSGRSGAGGARGGGAGRPPATPGASAIGGGPAIKHAGGPPTGTSGIVGAGGTGGGPPTGPVPAPGSGGPPTSHLPPGGGGVPISMNMGNFGQMGFNGSFGWQGGFPIPRDDLRASSNYIVAKLPTQANPRRMALTSDGKTLIVSNHLADSLTLIDAENLRVLRHIDLGGPKPDNARRGEIVFHSARFTFQQQFTCASCHPGNGSDGLTWNTSLDGQGEPFNSRDLRGVRDTGPFGWKGESDTFQQRAKNTMKEVHKHELSDAAASALASFLETLEPPRPLTQKEKDRDAIARGKELFHNKGNCKSCHRGVALTSLDPRAVIRDRKGNLTPLDVPSLRGVARTAPYLHDGRAETLEDIFLKHNPDKRHGKAHELNRTELNDLITYLKSL